MDDVVERIYAVGPSAFRPLETVVRCKDCIQSYREDGVLRCAMFCEGGGMEAAVWPHDFCSQGMRKERDGR